MRRPLALIVFALCFIVAVPARAGMIDDIRMERSITGKKFTARQLQRLERQQQLKEIERQKREEREALRAERSKAMAEARAAKEAERAEKLAAYETAKAARTADLAAKKAALDEEKQQAKLARETEKQARLDAEKAAKETELHARETEKQARLDAEAAAIAAKDEQMLALANVAQEQHEDWKNLDGWIDTDEGTRPAPRQEVTIETKEAPGTIIIDTGTRKLYYVVGDNRAIQYGIGVGRPGFEWMGVKSITRKEEWPDWRPPEEMIMRRPDLPRFMPGGPTNPLGARAMYLGSTLYRIHGSNEPESIGQAVSSGCFRMVNADVIDLYNRAQVGAKVIVR
jgi:lipoprotein-anchoring transpeptidase ErfK/SrfK